MSSTVDNAAINEIFGVAVNTLFMWNKTRPDYYNYLRTATEHWGLLTTQQQHDLFTLVDIKTIDLVLGVEKNFAVNELNVCGRTAANWIAAGKNRQYIGIVYGAAVVELSLHLEANGKSLELLKNADVNVLDLIFSLRHRATLFRSIVRTL